MGIIIDFIIVAIIGICLFLGYKRGLTGSILRILSFVLAIIIAFILFKPVSNFIIQQTKIDDTIYNTIQGRIVEVYANATNDKIVIENMPAVISDYINETIQNGNKTAEEASKEVANNVTNMIIYIATWILVFIIARIILMAVKMLSKIVVNIPVIKQVDKAGGILYGIVEGILIVYLAFSLVTFIVPMLETDTLTEQIHHSYIGEKMYNDNILLKIVF